MKIVNKEELKYYIIKDLDTGLYYRGKGQNRWGKYYNQASIFRNLAQANNSVEQLKIYDKSNAVAIEIEITELTQELSISECIKEWESRGMEVKILNNENVINIFNPKQYSVISINLENKLYIKTDSVIYSFVESITFDEHNLINKTIKAWEGTKGE